MAAVDELLLHLVLSGPDHHRRLLGRLGGAGRRRRRGQRFQPGRRRRLLRGERQRKGEQGDGEHSAKHGASLSFWDNARQARAGLEKFPWKKRCYWSTGRRICTAPSTRCPTCATRRASLPVRSTAY